MSNIEKNDLVGLTRDIDAKLTEGLVGRVVESNEDALEVRFPTQKETLQAQVALEDVKVIIGNLPVNAESKG
jgi:hypothetical protein